MALWSEGWISVTVKLAFMAGSSKQGKAFRASAACICVVATTFLQANLVSARGPLQGLAPTPVPPLALRPARSPVPSPLGWHVDAGGHRGSPTPIPPSQRERSPKPRPCPPPPLGQPRACPSPLPSTYLTPDSSTYSLR